MTELRCSWCGTAVGGDEGYRVAEPAGERLAVFCRLEHVVPWEIQGAHWEPGTLPDPPPAEPALHRCSHCDAARDDTRIVLVRHRGEYRIPDAFCNVEHLAAWARAGGRWRAGG